jgi:hypothetical protein
VVDRAVLRPIFHDPVVFSLQDISDIAYFCSPTGSGFTSASYSRIAVLQSNYVVSLLFLSSSILGQSYNSAALTGTGWTSLCATFDSTVTTTPKMWFYATGGPTGNQIVSFNEATSGVTTVVTITVGTNISRPYFGPDGLFWVLAGGALRRFNFPFSNSFALDGTSYATGITHSITRNHFATDGTSMYVLDTNATVSRIFKFTGITLNTTTSSPASAANMTAVAHDGRYLWVGKSEGGLYVYDTPSMTLVTTIAAPTLQSQALTGVDDLIFDGVYIIGIGTTAAGTRNVLFRIDPQTQRFVASVISTYSYSRLVLVPGDRNGGNVYTIYSDPSANSVQMIRDLADESVGSLLVDGGIARKPRVLDGGVDASPVSVTVDKSVVLVKTGTYGGGVTLLLPELPGNGAVITIKDIDGQASTNNITIDIENGGGNVDTISTDYGYMTLYNTAEGGSLWTRIG